MKKILFMIVILGFLFSGCSGSVTQSEFMQHSSHYKNCEHVAYSWFGYKKPTAETGQKSEDQAWWGIPVEMQK